MSEPLFEIVEGTTVALGPFTISLNGAVLDLTGYTITLVMHRASGVAVTPGGTITVSNQTTHKGELTYAPVAADFVWESTLYTIHQPYLLHWKLVDGAGKVAHAPSASPAIVLVHRA